MIEISWRMPNGKAADLAELRKELPFTEMFRIADVAAVRLSGADVGHAAVRFGTSIPWPQDVVLDGGKPRTLLPKGPVTWFGDHAKFIVANWR